MLNRLKQIGEYRHPITIEQYIEDEDDFGNPIEEWETFRKAWAKFEDLSGREYWDAKQVQSEVTGKIKTRYFELPDKEIRIKHQGRIIEIEDVFDPEQTKEDLVFMIKDRKRD